MPDITPSSSDDQNNLFNIQLERRRERALQEIAEVANLGDEKLFSTFEVESFSGRCYEVRIRSANERLNSCSCPDYRTNTLATCKHIEGVLLHLQEKLGKRTFKRLAARPPETVHVFLQHAESSRVMVSGPREAGPLGAIVDRFFDDEGALVGDVRRALPAVLIAVGDLAIADQSRVVVEPAVHQHIEHLERLEGIRRQKEWFLRQVKAGTRSLEVIGAKLYPYQVDGLLHLAFGGRVMLADDMGLGKTVQAIAATSLLHQLQGVGRVLVVCPASLKHQWAREIRRFTSFSVSVVEGPAAARHQVYRQPGFFTLINYELVLRDIEELELFGPDLVILDEAQRIKNWRTKTADAVKRLESRHAFVLTGTPLENRLDELYSVMQFIDPTILGPLWRFNERYVVGERRKSGSYKVLGYKNLGELRRRIGPYVVRRTRDEVLDDLPERTDNTFFVPLTKAQAEPYEEFQSTVRQLAAKAVRRPLSPKEQQLMLMSLAKMRMICDALALHDREIDDRDVEKSAPKLKELREILQDEVVEAGRKAVIFSQWTSMLDLVVPVLEGLGLGYVTLSGKVPTKKRGALIDRFRDDPECRVFLSTDAGGVGLNLQAASVVVNLELPWNPAVLEQRIARAHRHGQRNAVQVVNLVTRGTIEERMLDTLAAKRNVFAGVFGGDEGESEIIFKDSGGGLVQKLAGMLRPAEEVREVDSVPQEAEASEESEARAVAAPSEIDQLSDRLLALYPGRILVVERRPGASGGGGSESVLVVVDRGPAEMRVEVERVMSAVYVDGPPQLLMMEQEGYAALQAITGGGQQTGGGFRSPAVPVDDGERELRERLERVRGGLGQAERKTRLVRLMGEGGFLEEVLPHLRAALGWALSSHLALVDGFEPAEKVPGARVVQVELVGKGCLEAELAGRLALVRELTAEAVDGDEPPLPAGTVGEMAEAVELLIEVGRERLAGMLVGG